MRLIASALLLPLLALGPCADLPAATPLESLRAAYGGERLDAIRTFAYRLRLVDAEGTILREADYRLAPGTGRLFVESALDGSRSWWDGEAGWRQDAAGRWISLGESEATRLSGHARTHFLRLWRDPETRVETIAADRLRILPARGEGFEVRLDPATGLIVENRFDDGTVALESDYQNVGGVMWPMRFEVRRPGQSPIRAEFSQARVLDEPALPTPDLPTAADGVLETPQAGSAVRIAPGRISTPRNEYNLSVSEAAGLSVFARSDAKFANSRIWFSRRGADGWSTPVEAPFTDARYRDSDPWLTPDGRTLYFVSDRPAVGRGADRKDLDLWRVALGEAGEWGELQHLGEAINSPGYELGPELHGDTLYFNSARPGGPAGMSIYRAVQAGEGIFGSAEAMPAPFNDGRAQGDFTLSPDGRIALFWSMRGDRADGDLFLVRREGDGWSTDAIRLPAPFNSAGFDYTPAFSVDGGMLYLASDRTLEGVVEVGEGAGGFSDLYAVDAGDLPRE